MESRFTNARKKTMALCNPLETEDFVVQPHPDISPPKWHLGHTTWFLEELILNKFQNNFRFYNPHYKKIFNSYYKGLGEHWIQGERGVLSRPLVNEIFQYRQTVDEQIKKLLKENSDNDEIKKIIELAINHEEQHHELLLMDIKYILAVNPIDVTYTPLPLKEQTSLPIHSAKSAWQFIEEGVYEVGAANDFFAYDNEGPRHKKFLQACKISKKLVTNGEFLDFMNDNGYARPELWLSKGYDWVNQQKIKAPLYWKKIDGDWYEYTLHGLQKLNSDRAVNHISYFEADAFARWCGKRLPTEEEFEVAESLSGQKKSESQDRFHSSSLNTFASELWCWTKSHYSAYPGFKPFPGKIAEYNGKFMCSQFVMKGGCYATPEGHYRPSYRNFYEPGQRWMFSGLALAEDV